MYNRKVNHYSSDICGNALIYTTKEGEIVFRDQTIIKTNYSGFIKFYPTDSFVFTTTGLDGLRVYDTMKASCIFQYKQEELNDHRYSEEGIIATHDEYNLKFFNLKQRYMIFNRPVCNIKKLRWLDTRIAYISDDNLQILDFKNNKIVNSIPDVVDFDVSQNTLYYLSHGKLYMVNDGQVISKNSRFSTIDGIEWKSTNGVYGIIDKKLVCEENSETCNLDLGFKIHSIENILFGTNSSIFFVNKSLYITDVYDDLKIKAKNKLYR